MPVALAKGGSVSLSKADESSSLRKITIGLGWSGVDDSYDLDASAIILGPSGKALSDADFVFYNNLESPMGAVVHHGDQLSGGDGVEDDEQITVKLTELPAEAASIVFIVSIDQGETKGQSFGQLANAYIRIVNAESGEELARFSLSQGASDDIALVFGSVYRFGSEWLFRAIGDGMPGGLYGIVTHFGVDVA